MLLWALFPRFLKGIAGNGIAFPNGPLPLDIDISCFNSFVICESVSLT